MSKPSTTIVCKDCREPFEFTESEQEFYASRNLNAPQRCKECRGKRKPERDQEFDANCSLCGATCKVPFEPRPKSEGGRPVFCDRCLQKIDPAA